MAIANLEVINVGLQNESVGSDSLYAAFNKTKNNFAILANTASPYNTFANGVGITATPNSITGTVTFDNTGVTNIIAGTNIVVDQSNGNVTISSTGGGNGGGGTVTSVGVLSTTLNVSGSPVVSAGNITLNLPTTGVVAGSYTYPSVTVDTYGRVTSISNAASVGTVTSVGLSGSDGIQITGGPVTTSGTITVTNTGVTRLNAGTGIALSGSNGNVTISSSGLGGTVTSVGISSSQLVVSGSPVTSAGTISVNLPANISATGSVTIGTFLRLTPGTAPSSPTAGMVYYDSGSNTLKCYNGTSWLTITMS